MTVPNTASRTAGELLADNGIIENTTFLGPYTDLVERAVLTVPQTIMAAWERNDADLFASVFLDNGSLLMRDDQLTSRDQIRACMSAGFGSALRGARVTGWALQVSFLTPDVAMVVTQGGILYRGQEEIAPENEIRATWVIVARDGRWRLLSHQSSPVRGSPPTAARDPIIDKGVEHVRQGSRAGG